MKDGYVQPVERNTCAVVAISVATDTPYAEVHARLSNLGRRRNRRTKYHWTETVLEQLGWGMRSVTGHYSGRTIRSLAPQLEPHLRFLVRTRGHILAVRGGKAHDWTDGRLHRVKEIYQLVRFPKNAED